VCVGGVVLCGGSGRSREYGDELGREVRPGTLKTKAENSTTREAEQMAMEEKDGVRKADERRRKERERTDAHRQQQRQQAARASRANSWLMRMTGRGGRGGREKREGEVVVVVVVMAI